mmetsp:Transcript_22227/g.39956  ORF Transcript_22227/g.39956 Transcript_22227/m.39956 type:complete len:307 (+) Transcript_22227:1159-2079(+)
MVHFPLIAERHLLFSFFTIAAATATLGPRIITATTAPSLSTSSTRTITGKFHCLATSTHLTSTTRFATHILPILWIAGSFVNGGIFQPLRIIQSAGHGQHAVRIILVAFALFGIVPVTIIAVSSLAILTIASPTMMIVGRCRRRRRISASLTRLSLRCAPKTISMVATLPQAISTPPAMIVGRRRWRISFFSLRDVVGYFYRLAPSPHLSLGILGGAAIVSFAFFFHVMMISMMIHGLPIVGIAGSFVDGGIINHFRIIQSIGHGEHAIVAVAHAAPAPFKFDGSNSSSIVLLSVVVFVTTGLFFW